MQNLKNCCNYTSLLKLPSCAEPGILHTHKGKKKKKSASLFPRKPVECLHPGKMIIGMNCWCWLINYPKKYLPHSWRCWGKPVTQISPSLTFQRSGTIVNTSQWLQLKPRGEKLQFLCLGCASSRGAEGMILKYSRTEGLGGHSTNQRV